MLQRRTLSVAPVGVALVLATLMVVASIATAVSAAGPAAESFFEPRQTLSDMVLDANTSVVRIQRERPVERGDEWVAMLAVVVAVVAAAHMGWTPIVSKVERLWDATIASAARPRAPPTSI